MSSKNVFAPIQTKITLLSAQQWRREADQEKATGCIAESITEEYWESRCQIRPRERSSLAIAVCGLVLWFEISTKRKYLRVQNPRLYLFMSFVRGKLLVTLYITKSIVT